MNNDPYSFYYNVCELFCTAPDNRKHLENIIKTIDNTNEIFTDNIT